MTVGIRRAVYDHTEAAVHDLAPADAAAVVDRNPCGTAETVADDVMYCHVGAELRAVVDVGCLAERRVGSGYIMMVASQYDRSGDVSHADGLVESECYLGSAFAVCIEDACLGTYHEVIATCFLDPADIVHHLALDLLWSLLHYVSQYLGCDLIGLGKVHRVFGHADPAERSEAVIEEERAHDVLYI